MQQSIYEELYSKTPKAKIIYFIYCWQNESYLHLFT